MINPLIKLDRFLLDRVTQPVVNWLGREWGVTPERLGVQLSTAGCASYLLDAVMIVSDGDALAVLFATIIGIVITSWWIALIFVVAAHRKHDRILRYTLVYSRIFNLILIVFNTSATFMPPQYWRQWLAVMFAILIVAALYVLSCQNPPPRRQRQPRASNVEVHAT